MVYTILIAVVITVFSYMFGWVERKVVAKAQQRHGPTYVGVWGIFQNLADLVKMVAKENIVPDNADKWPYMLALPMIVVLATFVIFLIPFDPALQATNLGLGLLAIFVVISFLPAMIFIGGFSSGNKFADIGAQRSVMVLLAYELPLILVVASVGLLSNGFNISSIIGAQSSAWFIILMPIGFVVFIIAMLAEFERPPFDVREADSELIAGWYTDYSSPYFALGLLLDYTRMFLGSLLIAIMFLGGWEGPLLPPFVWLIAKATIVAFLIIFIRATTVRMRIDRLLRFGWVVLLPLSLINLILTYIIFIH